MINFKKIGVLGLSAISAFAFASSVNAETYWRITDMTSQGEALVFGEGEFSYKPSVSNLWENDVVVEGKGELNLQPEYDDSDGTKNFQMKVVGNELDSSTTYSLIYNGTPVSQFSGASFNEGVVVTLSPTKGSGNLYLTYGDGTSRINLATFACDSNVGECVDGITEFRYDTVKVVFSNNTNQNNYVEPEFDADEADKIKAFLEGIVKNGKIKLDTVDPATTGAKKELYDSLVTAAFIKQYDLGKYEAMVMPKMGDESAYIYMYYVNEETNTRADYSMEVEIEFAELSDELKEQASELKNKLKYTWEDFEKYSNLFVIEDLDSINYYYNISKTKNEFLAYVTMPNYSTKIHALTDNYGYDFMFDPRAGGGASSYYEPVIGPINILYNGTVIENIDPIGFSLTNVLYIPSDTSNSTEAFITAAKKRISEYLKDADITIEASTPIAELNEQEYMWDGEGELKSIIDLDKTSGTAYIIKINGKAYPYFIVADSSKMVKPTSITVDKATKVRVETDVAIVPLDTRTNVTHLAPNSEEYKRVAKHVSIINGLAYDINLYSTSLGMKIDKLQNGTFKVYIPLPNEYKLKKLFATYVNENGKVEFHEVKYENGYGVFTTDHFSVYAITEEVNPSTGDNVLANIIILGLSAGAIIILNRKFFFSK